MAAVDGVTAKYTLDPEKQKLLNQQKRTARITNEQFFRCHPELRTMTSAFMATLLREKPDDVPAFAARFFTNPDLAHELGLEGWSRPETPFKTSRSSFNWQLACTDNRPCAS